MQRPPPSTPQDPSSESTPEASSEAQAQKEATASTSSDPAEGSSDSEAEAEDAVSQAPEEGGTTGTEEQSESARAQPATVSGETGSSAESLDELAALERQLNESLAAYDDALEREQNAISKQRTDSENRQAEAHGANRTDRGSDSSTGEAGGGGHVQSSQSGAGPSSDREPADGEDVVARQLRKAAEEEKDPVLREKIWEEYRRYTGRAPPGDGATQP